MTGMIGRCFMNHYIAHESLLFSNFRKVVMRSRYWKGPSCIFFLWLMAEIWPNNTILNSWSFHCASLLEKSKQKSIVDVKWSIPNFFFCTSFPWISCQNSKDWITCKARRLEDFFIRSITTEIFQKSKWRLGNMPKIQGVKLERCSFTLVPKYIIISTWCFAAPRWNLRGKQPECKTRLHWLRGSRDLIRGTALSVRNAWERIWKRSC